MGKVKISAYIDKELYYRMHRFKEYYLDINPTYEKILAKGMEIYEKTYGDPVKSKSVPDRVEALEIQVADILSRMEGVLVFKP